MNQKTIVEAAKASGPKPLSPEAAKGAIDELIATAGRLIGMMEHETALLDRMKVSEIAAGQVEKDRLARGFEVKLRALAGDKAAVKALAPALRAEFEQAMARFRAAMGANERALRAAREANERVVKSIVDAAQAQSAPRHAYSAAGTMGTAGARERTQPIALDQRL
ncbi:MAG: hypothetical protein IT562_09600 [Alphaproteobacteria bacterium]|nr:hypothetical protein [Alphaproteobacteria bacterium]